MDRNAFLNRIAERLGRPRVLSAPRRDVVGVPEFYRAAPLGEGGTRDLTERFRVELEAVGGEVLIAPDLPAVHERLAEVLSRFGAERCVAWARAEFTGWELSRFFDGKLAAFGDPGLDGEEAFRRAALAADVGLTTVDFAVANTGTLVVSAAAGKPRVTSLLPTLHLALVRESQLVPRLGDALLAHDARALPSAVHCITGPSRTSDIENDLTIGVHGPAAVVAIVWRGA